MTARAMPGVVSPEVWGAGLLCGLLASGCGAAGAPGGARPQVLVSITPALATIPIAGRTHLVATRRDSAGTPVSGHLVTWSSADTTVAKVNGDGVVSGVGVGSTTIAATIGGESGQAGISVSEEPLTSVSLVGAGDIADCNSDGDERTAALLDSLAGTVFTAGDNAYSDGTASDFAQCYDASWGRHKSRTRPSPGNHDYRSSRARPYFDYFGTLAGVSRAGYYSYDVGAWHVISLNSNIKMGARSAQARWLQADLIATTARCVLAYWHHPRFSSGTEHGSDPSTEPLWQVLDAHAAEIIVSGHEHNYERFAPQTASGVADPDRGIRQFVVGTGGADHYAFGSPIANSEVRNGDTWGVLQLTLWPDAYTWRFIPVAGSGFADSGSGSCH